MLNGLCVPSSTPNNYFALSAAQWLHNLSFLISASHSQQAQNIERDEARTEYQKES